jgi:parallel beta-helix repeat protein
MKTSILFFLALLILACSASAATIDSCKQDGWAAGETYVLSKDVSTNASCMNIKTNSVTLDCQNHLISGNSEGTYEGIGVQGASGVTIKNCVIKHFNDGIEVDNVKSCLFSGNTISDIVDDGIDIDAGSDNNIAKNNNISKCDYGLMVTDSDNNLIEGNVFVLNRIAGIGIYSTSTNNRIVSNFVVGTKTEGISAGIALQDTRGNFFEKNSLESNTVGFGLRNSHSNTFKDDTANSNDVSGVLLVDSINNSFIGTVACNNKLSNIDPTATNNYLSTTCDPYDGVVCGKPCSGSTNTTVPSQIILNPIAGGCGEKFSKVVEKYHSKLHIVPGFMRSLLGNNLVHVYFTDEDANTIQCAVTVEDAVVVSYRYWNDTDGNNNDDIWDKDSKSVSMVVAFSEYTVNSIDESDSPARELLNSLGTSISYDGLNLWTNFKIFIGNMGLAIARAFV